MSKRASPKTRFMRGDSRNLRKLYGENRLAQAVVTSPPYFDLIDYGSSKQIGHDSKSYSNYKEEMEAVFRDSFLVSTEDATLWLICDNFSKDGVLIDIPGDLKLCASKAGWKLKDVIIWDKVKTRPWSRAGIFRNTIEYILFFVKDPLKFKFRVHRENELHGMHADYMWKWPERYYPFGRNPGKVWRHQITTQGNWGKLAKDKNITHIHYCPFPQSLVRRIINIATDAGDVVLDPFAGSGSVVVQAGLMGRDSVGIEINREFEDRFEASEELFKNTWEFSKDLRNAEWDDRIREALLIHRLRALKATNNFFMGGGPGEAGHYQRYVNGVLIVEQTTAAELVQNTLLSASNKIASPLQYQLHLWTTLEDSDPKRQGIQSWMSECLEEVALGADIVLHSGHMSTKDISVLNPGGLHLYAGEAGLRMIGGGLKRLETTKLPVVANFEANFGVTAAILKMKLLEVEKAIISEVAKSVSGDIARTASFLGTTEAHVWKYLMRSRGQLLGGSRTAKIDEENGAGEVEPEGELLPDAPAIS